MSLPRQVNDCWGSVSHSASSGSTSSSCWTPNLQHLCNTIPHGHLGAHIFSFYSGTQPAHLKSLLSLRLVRVGGVRTNVMNSFSHAVNHSAWLRIELRSFRYWPKWASHWAIWPQEYGKTQEDHFTTSRRSLLDYSLACILPFIKDNSLSCHCNILSSLVTATIFTLSTKVVLEIGDMGVNSTDLKFRQILLQWSDA